MSFIDDDAAFLDFADYLSQFVTGYNEFTPMVGGGVRIGTPALYSPGVSPELSGIANWAGGVAGYGVPSLPEAPYHAGTMTPAGPAPFADPLSDINGSFTSFGSAFGPRDMAGPPAGFGPGSPFGGLAGAPAPTPGPEAWGTPTLAPEYQAGIAQLKEAFQQQMQPQTLTTPDSLRGFAPAPAPPTPGLMAAPEDYAAPPEDSPASMRGFAASAPPSYSPSRLSQAIDMLGTLDQPAAYPVGAVEQMDLAPIAPPSPLDAYPTQPVEQASLPAPPSPPQFGPEMPTPDEMADMQFAEQREAFRQDIDARFAAAEQQLAEDEAAEQARIAADNVYSAPPAPPSPSLSYSPAPSFAAAQRVDLAPPAPTFLGEEPSPLPGPLPAPMTQELAPPAPPSTPLANMALLDNYQMATAAPPSPLTGVPTQPVEQAPLPDLSLPAPTPVTAQPFPASPVTEIPAPPAPPDIAPPTVTAQTVAPAAPEVATPRDRVEAAFQAAPLAAPAPVGTTMQLSPVPDEFAGLYQDMAPPAPPAPPSPLQMSPALTPEQVAAAIAAPPAPPTPVEAFDVNLQQTLPAAPPTPAPPAPSFAAPAPPAPPSPPSLEAPVSQLPGPPQPPGVAPAAPAPGSVPNPEVPDPFDSVQVGYEVGQPTFVGGPTAINKAGDFESRIMGIDGGNSLGINMTSSIAISPEVAAPIAEAARGIYDGLGTLGNFFGGPPSPPDSGMGLDTGPDISGGYTDVGGPSTGLDEGSNMDTDADLSGPDTGGFGGFGGFGGGSFDPDDSDDHGW